MPGLSKRMALGLLSGAFIISANLAVAFQAYRYFTALRIARADTKQVSVAKEQLQQQLASAQAEQEKLKGEAERLTTDRDNVLAQLKFAREQKDEAAEERNLFERILKQTAQEHREMKRRFAPLQEERDDLQRMYEEAAKERELLEAELTKVRQLAQGSTGQPSEKGTRGKGKEPPRLAQASEVKRVKDELAKEQREHRKTAQELRETQERAKELASRDAQVQARLAKLQVQYDDLQDHYTGLMAKNKTLANRAERVPTNVTKMAQQRERLIKETADMHYNLGVLFSNNKQFYQAAAEFRKALELRPDDDEAYYNLGVIYAEHLPDQEQAMTYFRKYLQLNPNSRDASWVKKYIASWQVWGGKERLE